MFCTIQRLYDTICRDPETGEGGLEPTASEFHASAFRRIDSVRAAKTAKQGNDRLVEIDYNGTDKYLQFANGIGSRRRSWHKVMIRIGYFAGDNHNVTQMVIGGDDKKIGDYIQKLDNIAGSCTDECLEKVEVASSEVIKIDEQRYELQISLKVQIR